MSRKTIINLVVLIALVTPMVIYYKYDTGKKRKIVDQLNAEYLSVMMSEKVDGAVSKIYHPYPKLFNDNPHQAYILIDDSLKRRITTGDELASDLSLDSLLSEGDRLRKDFGNDTLFIYKAQGHDTLRYSFELRDDQGYPLRKKR
jgi:hypothetical protein